MFHFGISDSKTSKNKCHHDCVRWGEHEMSLHCDTSAEYERRL